VTIAPKFSCIIITLMALLALKISSTKDPY